MSTSESQNVTPFQQKAGQGEVDLTITDAIANAIVVLAPDGTTLYANRVALDLSGIEPEKVGEEGFLQRAAHHDDVDQLLEQRRAGLLEGVPFQLEMRCLWKDGGYRWYLAQYKPLKDEQGRIIRWYATVTDIDDLKRA